MELRALIHVWREKRDQEAKYERSIQDAADKRTAHILAMIAEVNRDSKKRAKPYTFEDFYGSGDSEPESKENRTKRVLNKMRIIQASRPDRFKAAKRPE